MFKSLSNHENIIYQMKTLPIQKLAESLRSVSLDNSLSSCETTEAKHVLKQIKQAGLGNDQDGAETPRFSYVQ